MPMMGAKHSSRRPILKKFCTWVMSLVERVMRVAPEKRSISSLLKYVTLVNTSRRRSRATPAPMRAMQ